MDLTSQEERWALWSVQARNFARRESFTDAVARMKLVCASIDETLAQVTDPKHRARVERHRARAHELLAEVQSQHDAWRAAIAARRKETIEGAAEEMARPLPTQAD